MKKIAILAALALTGCVSPAQRQQNQANHDNLMAQVRQASADATVTCKDKSECDRMFDAAKSYVHSKSDMKVQISDSVNISTYNPTEWGYVGMSASRTPVAGGGSAIRLSVSCKGLYETYPWEACPGRVIPIYKGFKPYVSSAQ